MTATAGPNPLLDAVFAKTRTQDFRDYVTDLLMRVCAIDTTPNSDVSVMRAAESAVFNILEDELGGVELSGLSCERRPVNPGIAAHAHYSLLHFTKTDDCPEGLTPEEVYAGRSNLIATIPGREADDGVAVNAHIDVVAPYMPPTLKDGVVRGRGSCDDKGGIVAMVGALRVLAAALKEAGCPGLARNLVFMFVVEEETGGNGSLSLAMDRDLKTLYDSILVLECTGNQVHPANRGAVWYKADLTCPGVSLFEMFAYINEQMEKEGRAIKAESRHALFPQRPVQTCHGIIGSVGEHPSRICGEVSFRIDLGAAPEGRVDELVRDAIDAGLTEYVALYGDKTKVIDSATGHPKVERHLDITTESTGYRIDVHGATGHMGSILENDGAITKMATLVRHLVRSKAKISETTGKPVELLLVGTAPDAEHLALEGGQGFVPTHDITEVMARVACAAQRGAEAYLRMVGRSESGEDVVAVTYDKLHNAAFDGDPESAPMLNALAAADDCGMEQQKPIMGWTVSCDARLFASEYPGMPVVTFGPGLLAHAHSDEEQLDIDELVKAVEFIAAYILRQAGP